MYQGSIHQVMGKSIRWERISSCKKKWERNWEGEGRIWRSNISSYPPPFNIELRKKRWGGGDNKKLYTRHTYAIFSNHHHIIKI